ncbi:hypothetical protein GOP47_0014951 [Adiantum capillus-veneris]|uniref:Uncharacterized protein n=1 Tax=Adiantum capillus-veneris TaxID=13818 RepID=A0A9D4UNP2_ADICA|nr:hypothetical protein GOP47_0014951 [Adiantum capillus-veneris]
MCQSSAILVEKFEFVAVHLRLLGCLNPTLVSSKGGKLFSQTKSRGRSVIKDLGRPLGHLGALLLCMWVN